VKVLAAVDSLGPGGAERSLIEVASAVAQDGIDVEILCLRSVDQGLESDARDRGLAVRHLGSGNRVARIRRVRRAIRDLSPDVVQSMLFEADIAARLAAVGTGVPVLTSLVSVAYDPSRFRDPAVSPLKLRAARAIDGWTARHLTTHFHAVTETVKRSAVRVLRIPPDRVTVVERGRDLSRLGEPSPERRSRARERLGLPADAEIVLNVGRQEYAKGQEHLLEGVAPLLERRPRLVVLIAGRRGAATTRLEERHRRLRLGDRVRFLGHRDDVPDLLAAADVFTSPSIYEGFGGSIAEAMALELPVVSSDLPTLRDVVEPGGTALLVPPERPLELGRAIEALLDDPALRRRLGTRGRELCETRFTLERSSRRMADMYRRAANLRERSEVSR
jgi:glycosyltransferase involved in cell wall biosynthesis